jgi:hypothetical protein
MYYDEEEEESVALRKKSSTDDVVDFSRPKIGGKIRESAMVFRKTFLPGHNIEEDEDGKLRSQFRI